MQDNQNNQHASHLAKLIGETPDPDVASLWQRLDLEEVARRLIQTARVAAAEHALLRAQDAIDRRDAARNARTVRPADRRTA